MPGVGKSTIGVILAKIIGLEFLDSDLLIQKQEKKLLKDIIEKIGSDGFLALENTIHAQLDVSNCIISTGGSVVYSGEAMQHLKDISTIVYLKLDYVSLEKRLGNLTARGVVLKNDQTLKNLYDERIPLYEQYADLIVDETDLSVESTIDAVLHALKSISYATHTE